MLKQKVSTICHYLQVKDDNDDDFIYKIVLVFFLSLFLLMTAAATFSV